MEQSVIAGQLNKIEDALLCGIRPDALDPLVQELVSVVGKLLAVARAKAGDAKKLEGMSMADLSKAIMALQKALDGTARLRSFAAGGPDARPVSPEFILKVMAPGEAPANEPS